MTQKVYVVGVGMTPFEKPGARDWDYPDMAREAGQAALKDAGLSFEAIEQAFVGYVYGESTCGQRAVYELGLTGIPIYNVNNNCSTGSTALFMARQLIAGGLVDCALALGFEKMERGSLGFRYQDRALPLDKHFSRMVDLRGEAKSPPAPQIFGNAGLEHMERYGSTPEQFARVAQKNHAHSAHNPNAQFQQVYTLEEIMESKTVYGPLTKLQCCPTSDGAAAAILASERFVREHDLWETAVEISGQAMTTDYKSTFDGDSIKLIGSQMTEQATKQALAQAKLTVDQLQVIELHDCFSTNELVTYEALGLCPEGQGGHLIDEGQVTYGGKWVVNPSGGLISKGHPLGATGLAQCTELCWQLRNMAGARQVAGATAALQHNLGLGGAAVVTVYHRN